MLTFVGLGLSGRNGLTHEAKEVLRESDTVYLDTYTSPTTNGIMRALSAKEASRAFVEDGRTILEESLKRNVALISYGDPMIATTHMDLRVRAERLGIHTRVVHNTSIQSAIPGETGLHSYTFGRTVTMTRAPPAKNLYVYHSLHSNLLNGLHSLILLEYDSSSEFFLAPGVAIKSLLETEREQRKGVFPEDCFLIVCSRIGQKSQRITAGKAESLSRRAFGRPPHAMVLPGQLHYTEEEALQHLCKISRDSISANSSRVKVMATDMVTKYVAKALRALSNARRRADVAGKRFDSLFENVESYTLDAERFLNEGKHELAVLSIGYAEGLLDSLNFTGQLKIDW